MNEVAACLGSVRSWSWGCGDLDFDVDEEVDVLVVGVKLGYAELGVSGYVIENGPGVWVR